MRTRRETEASQSDRDALWAEAFWGLGLMGSVLLCVVLIAALFGR
jgi:hypothetical protein